MIDRKSSHIINSSVRVFSVAKTLPRQVTRDYHHEGMSFDPLVLQHPRKTPVGSSLVGLLDVFLGSVRDRESDGNFYMNWTVGSFQWGMNQRQIFRGNMPHSRYSMHGIYYRYIHFNIFWPIFGYLRVGRYFWSHTLSPMGLRSLWNKCFFCQTRDILWVEAHHDFVRPSDAQKLEVLFGSGDQHGWVCCEKNNKALKRYPSRELTSPL